MNYDQALAYLASLNRFGIQLGLARIEKLLALMQHPERRYRTIHITGTNGKGSTTAMLAAILHKAGIRTGMYTSPHLIDYTERMQVNGEPVSRAGFAQAIDYVRRFVEVMIQEGGEHPTEFEVLTAAAFYYFAAAGVEYAVIEVGLGGLLDSTNVIMPEVAVITNVTLEHTDKCGDTVEAIARHKAGIIKQGKPVVTAAAGTALTVIEQTALEKGCELYRMGREFDCVRADSSMQGQEVCWCQADGSHLERIPLRMLGQHQVMNAGLAIMTAQLLAERDTRISPAAIREGVACAVWPGRFEWIAGAPDIVIDGAHNPAGADTLRRGLDEYFPGKPVTFVLGVLRDKDQTGIIRALLRGADRVIVVRPDSERAAEPRELAALIEDAGLPKADSASALAEGIEKARRMAGAHGVVCIAGSLYLVGEARRIVYNK